MSPLSLEILLILGLILANGVFSMAEIAMVSARKPRLKVKAEDGDSRAKTALELSESPNRFLSTAQIGISLIGILVGAVGAATLTDSLAVVIHQIGFLDPYANAIALTVVVLTTTYFTLVLGELIPKRLGLNNPERIAILMARPMQFLSRLTAPVVHLLSISTDLGLRLLGTRPTDEPSVTEDDIRVLLDQGTQVGVFEEAEQDMVESIFRLGEWQVNAIMNPRTEVEWLDLDESLEDNIQKALLSNHSIFPVGRGNLDNVIGILLSRDLLALRLKNQPIELKNILRPPIFVPESTPALKALELLKTSNTHMALVIDEYGGFQGIVTLYDILEAIVGDVPNSGDFVEPEVVQREDGSWLFDGMLQIDEFTEILGLDELSDEDRTGFQTLGGFVMTRLGSIPITGQQFEWEGYCFEVVDMDGRRVDKVLVTPITEAPEPH
jgi:putative hemolysin